MRKFVSALLLCLGLMFATSAPASAFRPHPQNAPDQCHNIKGYQSPVTIWFGRYRHVGHGKFLICARGKYQTRHHTYLDSIRYYR